MSRAGGRRIKKTVTNAGGLDGTELYYYNGGQTLEVRDGSEQVVREYLWGRQYLEELVCLWVQKGYHMFVAHDANYNAIGLTDKAGNEVEKYAYTPYGQVLVDQTSGRGDFDGDGDVDSADNTLLDNNKTGSPTEAQLLYDLDGDGDVDDADDTAQGALVGADYRNPGRALSGVGNDRLFTMQTLDAETLNYHYKARGYNSRLSRFAQRDQRAIDSKRVVSPLELLAHSDYSEYSYVASNPPSRLDPSGLSWCQNCPSGYCDAARTAHTSACRYIRNYYDYLRGGGYRNRPECLEPLVRCMVRRCNEVHPHCDLCCHPDPYGYTRPGCRQRTSNHYFLCQRAFNEGSRELAITSIHEVSHCCGATDDPEDPCEAESVAQSIWRNRHRAPSRFPPAGEIQ